MDVGFVLTKLTCYCGFCFFFIRLAFFEYLPCTVFREVKMKSSECGTGLASRFLYTVSYLRLAVIMGGGRADIHYPILQVRILKLVEVIALGHTVVTAKIRNQDSNSKLNLPYILRFQ